MKTATVEERRESGKNLFKALMVCAEQSEDTDEATYLELATNMVALAWKISRLGVSAAVAMNLLTKEELRVSSNSFKWNRVEGPSVVMAHARCVTDPRAETVTKEDLRMVLESNPATACGVCGEPL